MKESTLTFEIERSGDGKHDEGNGKHNEEKAFDGGKGVRVNSKVLVF